MTERSYFWGGTTTGDAVVAPYDDDEFTDALGLLFTYDRRYDGVVDTGHQSYTGGLIVNGGAGQVTVQTGVAVVDGKIYTSTAATNVTIPTPAASTRIDRIVLRKDFAAQTVRITRIAGTEGAGVPAITQTDGVTWDIALAQVSITTGAVITVTNEARAVRTPLGPGYQYDWFGASSDSTWTAGGSPESISSGVSFSLGPGKWLVGGQIQFEGTGAAGPRYAYVTLAGSTVALTRYDVLAGELGEPRFLTIAPTIIDVASTSTLELKFFAGNVADIVYGSADDFGITTLIATRVI